MATLSAVTHPHLMAAIAEYDDRGKDAFIGVYGLQAAPTETLLHEGRTYDAAAIVGVAHRYATGRVAMTDELGKQAATVTALLRKHGFEVTAATAAASGSARTARSRAAAARTPRAASTRTTTTRVSRSTEEKPAVICPTCFTQLPATGVCDTCS